MLKYNLSKIENISKKIILNLSKKDCILLYGELGSGKTTFTRSLINLLQKNNKIQKTEVPSPTFNLVYEYEIKEYKIMHYDLYRLKNKNEINELGIFNENFDSVKIIEWPEKIAKKIKDRLEIKFYYQEDQNVRKLKLNGHGKWKNFNLNAI